MTIREFDVGFIDWMLRRQPDPTRNWPENAGELPVVRTEPFSLGGVRLGDVVEAARPLGRPEKVRRSKLAGAFGLIYVRWGVELEFEENRLVDVLFVIGETWLSTIKGSPCRPRLADGTQLSPETTVEQVVARFGEPNERGTNQHNETVLDYEGDGVIMSFEFDKGRLEAWDVSVD
jgi:hypothetical protein